AQSSVETMRQDNGVFQCLARSLAQVWSGRVRRVSQQSDVAASPPLQRRTVDDVVLENGVLGRSLTHLWDWRSPIAAHGKRIGFRFPGVRRSVLCQEPIQLSRATGPEPEL